MSRAIAKTYTFAKEYRIYLTGLFMAGCLIMILVYTFNIYAIVSKTVALRGLESEVAAVANSVQELDARYIEISARITPDTLRAHGFAQAEVSEYIARPASLSRLSPSVN